MREKNTLTAFRQSFALGYGTETDFRDFDGNLVIEHDLPSENSLKAELFFELLKKENPDLTIAINIKSDGLQNLIKNSIQKYNIKNYFLFDMSVPDAIVSIKNGLRVFTRQSDVEEVPAFYSEASGIWLDSFFDDKWLKVDQIKTHLQARKAVCIVSPELHQRNHLPFWELIKRENLGGQDDLIICTDYPEEACSYFKK